MADLINRDHAAQAIEAYLCSQCDYDTDRDPECIACSYLDGDEILKSVPAVNRWIPCSERLPESNDDVLIWFEYYRYGDYNRLYQTYGIGNYFSHHDNWLVDKSTGWRDLHVIAWMPVNKPEPPEKE